MAIIVGTPQVQVSGKVGSMVFTSQNGEKVVRNYSNSKPAGSSLQLYYRDRFSDAVNAWRSLPYDEVWVWQKLAYMHDYKHRAYQYFIHCFIHGVGPVQFDYHHLIEKRTLTPVEISCLGTANIELVPAPGLNKFILLRHVFAFIATSNFDVYALNIGYPSYINLFNFVLSNFPNSVGIGPALDCRSQNSGDTGYNEPIVLSSNLQPVTDLGGSSNLNIQVEYSIFDWLNA
jgi:hypothetical protein